MRGLISIYGNLKSIDTHVAVRFDRLKTAFCRRTAGFIDDCPRNDRSTPLPQTPLTHATLSDISAQFSALLKIFI